MIFTIIWYIMKCLGISVNVFGAVGLDLLNLIFIALLMASIIAAKKYAEES